jgi:hypothetical protein
VCHCYCFLEYDQLQIDICSNADHISLKFCSNSWKWHDSGGVCQSQASGDYSSAKLTLEDIEAEYDNYRDQLMIMADSCIA